MVNVLLVNIAFFPQSLSSFISFSLPSCLPASLPASFQSKVLWSRELGGSLTTFCTFYPRNFADFTTWVADFFPSRVNSLKLQSRPDYQNPIYRRIIQNLDMIWMWLHFIARKKSTCNIFFFFPHHDQR